MAPCPGAGQTNTKYKTTKWHLAQVEANTASRLIFEVEGGDSDRGFAAVDEILVRKVDICATTPTNAVPGMKLKIGGQIAKWDFLQAVRQQVARRPPARVQVWNDQSPQPTSYCYGCHHGCNPGLKLPSCSFEEDNCGWNSVIELNATKWFRFQR